MAKEKREMSLAHKKKLSEAYWKRKKAKEQGVHLPTRKEEREATRASKVITAENIRALTVEPMKEDRASAPAAYPIEASDHRRLPERLRAVQHGLTQR
jgi:hypothetical protein